MKIKWHALKQPKDQRLIRGKVENRDEQNKTNGTVAITGHSDHSTGRGIYDYKTYIKCKKDIKTTISFCKLS